MKCPNCSHVFDPGIEVPSGVEKTGYSSPDLFSVSSPDSSKLSDPNRSDRARVRGKAREYSDAFEVAWKAYPRKEEKFKAWSQWLIEAHRAGGENTLLPLILAALSWQKPNWAKDDPKFVKYFERYLRARKWEDERPVAFIPPPRETEQDRIRREQRARDRRDTDRQIAATDRYLADLHGRSNGSSQPAVQSLVAELAEQKAVTK